MKLAESAHTSQPWRIHEIAADFRLEDVWALPTPGGPDDFPRLVELMESFDPAKSTPAPVRALFALRMKLGEVLGWDSPKAGLGSRVPTLRDCLPADLRETAASAAAGESHFRGLYRTENELALEIANQTVHAILHLGWVPDGAGRYRGQMAVLVKPNGLFGQAYMAAITPFRYLLVYPAMLRELGREWPLAAATS
jgi:hypothetical protein